MIDHGPVMEPEVTLAARDEGAGRALPALPSFPELEERLRRLEDAVAALQETRRVEELRADGASAVAACQPTTQTLAEGTAVIADAGRRLLPLTLNLHPPAAELVARTQPWLIWDAYEDLRSVVRMFFDRRYRVRLSAWLIPVSMLFFMLFSWMFIGGILVVGPLLDKAVDLVLAFLCYKVLVREAHRYRAALAHLSAYPRP